MRRKDNRGFENSMSVVFRRKGKKTHSAPNREMKSKSQGSLKKSTL